MEELAVDAVNQRKAALCRDATALDQQVAAVFGDGHHCLDIVVAVEIKGAVVAVTGQPEAVKGILVKDHLGDAWQVAGHVGEPGFRQHHQVIVGARWTRLEGLQIEYGGVAAEPVRPEASLLLKHIGVPAGFVEQFHLAIDLLHPPDWMVGVGVADKKQPSGCHGGLQSQSPVSQAGW